MAHQFATKPWALQYTVETLALILRDDRDAAGKLAGVMVR